MEAEKRTMKILALGLFGVLLSAKQPQLAVQGDTTWMAYTEGNKIFVKSSTHGAARWSKPVEIADQAQFPRIALLDGKLHLGWHDGRQPQGSVSADGGKTWVKGGVCDKCKFQFKDSADAFRWQAQSQPISAWAEGKTLWVQMPDRSRRMISDTASSVSAVERPGGGILLAWDGASDIETYDVVPPMPLPKAPSRSEILQTLEREMYGKAPAKPAKQGFELRERSEEAFGGKAIRKQLSLWYEGPPGKRGKMELLMYLPKTKAKVPVFLGMSFGGNSCANADPAIFESTAWQRTPQTRGGCASRFEAEYVISRGYGTAIVYYGDLDPDFDDGFENGVHAVYGKPKADEWGSIAAWAWGMSRAMDYLEQDPQVDAKHVAVHGHSRIGKAALWAGALDERFAMVISNDSGEGGAAVSRRKSGERTADLNKNFPHWFDGNFKKYSGKEETLPFDSHWVIRAVAPRLMYTTSASEDLWADPEGEFAGMVAAGMKPREMLKPGERYFEGRMAYHLRLGKHDITKWDWEGFMDFADQHHWRP